MYEFNDQQAEKIQKHMKSIMEDIKNLMSSHNTIYLQFYWLKTNIPEMKLAKWNFACHPYRGLGVYWTCFDSYHEENSYFDYDESDWSSQESLAAASVVIENYSRIRLKLIKEIKKQIKNYERENKLNQKTSSKIDLMLDENLDKKIDDSAIIKFRCPDSMNVRELELKEENGKKIGYIDFGDMAVEIITNGSIVLANKGSVAKKAKRKERR